jgi:hypothetical protein
MRASLVVVGLVAAGSVAGAAPRFTSGPDRAFNCTHYLGAASGWKKPPRVEPGEAMDLTLPDDKVMKFTLAAQPTKKKAGKVTFALEGAPAGATLDGAAFAWKVAGVPGQTLAFAIVASDGPDSTTKWPIKVTIADRKLFTAWSAGMGSVWPDCDVYQASGFTVEDLDGDGKDDVIFRKFSGSDDSTETTVMLQRGDMKFVEAASCDACSPRGEIAIDGTRLLVDETDCCCILTVAIQRLDGDHYVKVETWQVTSGCADPYNPITTITFDRDAKNRIKGATHTTGGKDTTFVWRDHRFVEQPSGKRP